MAEIFHEELWSSLRPYILHLIKDWVISVFIWGMVWGFKQVTKLLPIDGWPGELITNIHSFGAILAVAVFTILLVFDIYRIHKNG